MRARQLLALLILAIFTVTAACSGAPKKNPDGIPDGASVAASVVRGGLLYDKWWKTLKRDAPDSDQPLWAKQSTNKRSGGTTWRCKECHGWDYRGKDGVYSAGSHFTGFPGVYDARTKEAAALRKALTSGPHDFSSLGGGAVDDLVAFLRWGMVDLRPFVDDKKKVINADLGAGKSRYAKSCAECHGADGKKINFGSDDKPVYLGAVARKNPWETIHKIRFGQPGTKMPSGIRKGWDLKQVRDIAAYSQTLP